VKILVFNWQDIKNPLGGGAEVHLQEIFGRIAAQGHSVTLVCSKFRGGAPRDTIGGIRVIRVGTRNLFNFAVPLWHLFFGHTYDVVVDDINKIPFYTPVYVRKPIVAIVHHLFGKSIFMETNPLAASYVYAAERLIPKIYRHVPIIAVSESTKNELTEQGIPADTIRIIHNCVDHSLYKPGGFDGDRPFTIGFLGRIKKYKSIDHLLSAFIKVKERVPDAKLVIIGDGDYLPALEKTAAKLPYRDDITFTGYVSGEEKVRLLRNTDIVVNTSSKEGWGLTVIEANACGIPVIGADVPGLRDSIRHDETGLLYPYGDIDALYNAIMKLKNDTALLNRLSEKAILWAAGFNWDSAAEEVLKVISDAAYEWKFGRKTTS
jgi:glycosyltransferase involved in cell wall biosynthesis